MNVIVELVKLGFLGFAVAIVFYSFALMRKVIRCDAPDEKIKALTRSVWIFMGMSILVILIGMAYEFFNPKLNLSFNLSPENFANEYGEDFLVKLENETVDLKRKSVLVSRDRNGINLELTGIYIKLIDQQRQIKGLEDQITSLRDAQATQEGISEQELQEEGGI